VYYNVSDSLQGTSQQSAHFHKSFIGEWSTACLYTTTTGKQQYNSMP